MFLISEIWAKLFLAKIVSKDLVSQGMKVPQCT